MALQAPPYVFAIHHQRPCQKRRPPLLRCGMGAPGRNAMASSRVSPRMYQWPDAPLAHSPKASTSALRPAITSCGMIRGCVAEDQPSHHSSKESTPVSGSLPIFRANHPATAGARSSQAIKSSTFKAQTSAQWPSFRRLFIQSSLSLNLRVVTNTNVV